MCWFVDSLVLRSCLLVERDLFISAQAVFVSFRQIMYLRGKVIDLSTNPGTCHSSLPRRKLQQLRNRRNLKVNMARPVWKSREDACPNS